MKSPNYEITYAFQVILLLNTAAMHSMIDVLILNLYLAMVGQLEILKRDYRLIAKFSDTEEEDSEFISQDILYYNKKNLKEIFRERLVKRNQHYEAIVS